MGGAVFMRNVVKKIMDSVSGGDGRSGEDKEIPVFKGRN